MAKFLLNRLNAHLDQAGLIPESQCGFRKDKGTIDMIFTARQQQDAFQDVDAGFPIRYRFDGKLLNLRRLQAKSKV